MTHQFAVGDTVRLNGTQQETKVVGFKEATGSEGPLICVELAGIKMYFPINSVTLISPHRAVESDHPDKIETVAKARDVTTTWDGGYKIHEPRKIET